MFPSGVWRGFWHQEAYGRQAMEAFELRFRGGAVTGRGVDVIGPFVFRGEYEERTGRVRMVKQYVGRHRVAYDGGPDGEGCIAGTWSIPEHDGAAGKPRWAGPFRIHPDVPRPTGDEPIHELGK